LSKIIAPIFFWPEALKVKQQIKTPSVLTSLPDTSALKLPWIAFRKPRPGGVAKSKKAIRHIVDIQALKIVCVAFGIMAEFMYNSHGLAIGAALVVGFLFDWSFWSTDHEIALRREIYARLDEIEVTNPSQQLDRYSPTRSEVQKSSALHKRVENAMINVPIDLDADKPISYDRDNLAPASAETDAYLVDMMQRADARRTNAGLTYQLNPSDHVTNGYVVLDSHVRKSVRVRSNRRGTIAVKSF
jgi:hypothetical protein